MFSLSQTTGYAILALACLEGPGGAPVSVQDVAECRGIAKPYLSKVIHSLARKGLVATRRGPGGGLLLTRPPEMVSLWEIAEAVEGPEVIGTCMLGIHGGRLDACPTQAFWDAERGRIEAELRLRKLSEVQKVTPCCSTQESRREPFLEAEPTGEER